MFKQLQPKLFLSAGPSATKHGPNNGVMILAVDPWIHGTPRTLPQPRRGRRREQSHSGTITGAWPPADLSTNPQIQGKVDGAGTKANWSRASLLGAEVQRAPSTVMYGPAAVEQLRWRIPSPLTTNHGHRGHHVLQRSSKKYSIPIRSPNNRAAEHDSTVAAWEPPSSDAWRGTPWHDYGFKMMAERKR
jgi:hypothetical protein